MKRFALVVDDEPIISSLIASVLQSRDFSVEVADGAAAARALLNTYDPDVAVVDLNLGDGPNGVDIAHYINRRMPEVAVLLLTKYAAPELMGYDLSGLPDSVGFLEKAQVSNADVLVAAIEAVLSEQAASMKPGGSIGELAVLTATQLEVLRLMAQGYSTSDVARLRGRTVSTTEQLITTIYQRLDLPSDGSLNQRAEAVRIFVANVGLPPRRDADV